MSSTPTQMTTRRLTMQQGDVQVAEGFDAGVQPADLPAPNWFIAVNPGACDHPENEPTLDLLNQEFCEHNQDAYFCLVRGSGFDAVRKALREQALIDAPEHAQCENGGLYACWTLTDGSVVVAGFDNGGSDIAQAGVEEVARKLGASTVDGGRAAHFSYDSPNPQHQVAVALANRVFER